MWSVIGITLLLLSWICRASETGWKDYNCPAPRSPENGLSFIFRDGAVVHYKCHPGYTMRGRSYAYCTNNKWNSETPKCIPNDGYQEFRASTSYTQRSDRIIERPNYSDKHTKDGKSNRQLFDWENDHSIPYGDREKRLPLINGIWKPSEKPDRVLSIGTTRRTSNRIQDHLISEELEIAELRQRQMEEVERRRYGYTTVPDLKHRERKPHYHGSISVVVLPPTTTESNRLKQTRRGSNTNKPRRGKDKGKNKNKNKNKNKKRLQEEFRQPLEIKVGNNQSTDGYYNPNGSSSSGSVLERKSRPYKPPGRPSSRHNRYQLQDPNESHYDDSCYENSHGKTYPMRAPQVPNAFAYKYERRSHSFDDTYYLIVHYRCRYGYKFRKEEVNKLYCRESHWIGETPLCD